MSSHSPIILTNVGMSYLQKVCFEGVFVSIYYGRRIALVGDNGSGKSTLLKVIQGMIEPFFGHMTCPSNVRFGYVPQLINDFEESSGAEKFNGALTHVLASNPNVLCLDEPTNHLDLKNRHSLLRMLDHYPGTLLIASHDVQLLEVFADEIWAIENGGVTLFKGGYKQYIRAQELLSEKRLKELDRLEVAQKKERLALQFEEKRAAQSKRANIHENDRSLKAKMKETGSRTVGKNLGRLNESKKFIDESLQMFKRPEKIHPRFNLRTTTLSDRDVVSIGEASCGYRQGSFVLKDITLRIGARERVAILGDNGAGKSTLLKAILNDPHIKREGTWSAPKLQDIGYLDQHYGTLDEEASAYEMIKRSAPNWQEREIRRHLNDFLFRKNEEVFSAIQILSEGEKARLSLAIIAVKTPKILILDEITNNLDLKHKFHIVQVLKFYPGALLVISHDLDFLKNINLETHYEIKNGEIYSTSFS